MPLRGSNAGRIVPRSKWGSKTPGKKTKGGSVLVECYLVPGLKDQLAEVAKDRGTSVRQLTLDLLTKAVTAANGWVPPHLVPDASDTEGGAS